MKAKKCSGSELSCQRNAISTAWHVNESPGHYHATWRERAGVHTFVSSVFPTGKEALFEPSSWHTFLLQACFRDNAVYFIVSAVGILYQQAAKPWNHASARSSEPLSFALWQCNKAIKVLLDSSSCEPVILLLTCVLFAHFESFRGHPEQAVTFALQGRKLLSKYAGLLGNLRGDSLVDAVAMRPVIGSIEVQAKALCREPPSGFYGDCTGLLTLPNVAQIQSLDHAKQTLQYSYIGLFVYCQDEAISSNEATRPTPRECVFSPWFRQWERAFADFCFKELERLTPLDMQRVRVLKANLLTAKILCASYEPYEECENDCKTIVELSSLVLKRCYLSPELTLSNFQRPSINFDLWIAEPLFVVMSRCQDRHLCNQARSLLDRQLQACNVRLMVGLPVYTASTKLEERTKEQLIIAFSKTRVDVDMSNYFSYR